MYEEEGPVVAGMTITAIGLTFDIYHLIFLAMALTFGGILLARIVQRRRRP